MMWKFMFILGGVFIGLGVFLLYVNSYNPLGSGMYPALFQMFGSAIPLFWFGYKIRKDGQ